MLRKKLIEHHTDEKTLTLNHRDGVCLQQVNDVRLDGIGKAMVLTVVDQCGRSGTIRITNFQPYIFVGLEGITGEPDVFDPDKPHSFDAMAVEAWIDELNDEIKENSRFDAEKTYTVNYITGFNLEYRKPFVGCVENKLKAVARITFKNISKFMTFTYHLRDHKDTMRHLEFCHMPTSKGVHTFGHQFLVQKDCSYQQWFQVKNFTTENFSNTNFCLSCDMEDLVKMEAPTVMAPILKMVITSEEVSRDGLKSQKPYKPNGILPFDRALVYVLSFSFSHLHKGKSMQEYVLTHLPLPEKKQKDKDCLRRDYFHFDNEQDMLRQVSNIIMSMDPDVNVFFPDPERNDPFFYLMERLNIHKLKDHMNLERLVDVKPKTFRTMKDPNPVFRRIKKMQWTTRSVINTRHTLQKKVFIPIPLHTIHGTASMDIIDRHPKTQDQKVRKKPVQLKTLLKDPTGPNFWLCGQTDMIIAKAIQDNRLIRELESEMNMLIEYVNISTASFTDLSTVTTGGEQARVMNNWCANFEKEGYVNNQRMLKKGCLKLPINQYPPTFQDIPEHQINLDYRTKAFRDFVKKGGKNPRGNKRKQYTMGLNEVLRKQIIDEVKGEKDDYIEEDDDNDDPVEAVLKEGGNVIEPAPYMYDNDLRAFILDFASLYPSIMLAINLCYSNVYFDMDELREALRTGKKVWFFKINANYVVAVRQRPGFIPMILKRLLAERKKLKKLKSKHGKLAKQAGDRYNKSGKQQDKDDVVKHSFLKAYYDGAQQSMKILCNATYGFVGVGGDMGLCPLKELMYVVTCIGRFLQNYSSDYFATKYNIVTVYGDSVLGSTALLLRKNNLIKVQRIDSLWMLEEKDDGKKQYIDLEGWETWTEKGWTKIKRIMRHRTTKKIMRVTTHTGSVDVTEDHSLINKDGKATKPTEVAIGDHLLHSFPSTKEFNGGGTISLEKAEVMGKDMVHVPSSILNAPLETREAFWKGYTENDSTTFEFRTQVSAMGLYTLARSIGWNVSVNTRKDKSVIYRMTCTKRKQRKAATIIKKIVDMGPCNDYVYDLTTENHHFQAGVGQMIVHNTDSIFTLMDHVDSDNLDDMVRKTGKLYWMDEAWAEIRKGDLGGKELDDVDRVFCWESLVRHFKQGWKLDITGWSKFNKINAMMHAIGNKLCEEINDRYIKHLGIYHIILELENMCTNMWMRDKKKKYFLQFWNEKNPSQILYVKVKGMDFNKRVLCDWVRGVCHDVKHMLLQSTRRELRGTKLSGSDEFAVDKQGHLHPSLHPTDPRYCYTHDEILPYLKQKFIDLRTKGRIRLQDIVTTYKYKTEQDYKHPRLIHYQVKLQEETRRRARCTENSRLEVVVIRGKDKLFMRGRTPDAFRANQRKYKKNDPRRWKIDRSYYAKKQLFANLEKMFFHHQHLFDVNYWRNRTLYEIRNFEMGLQKLMVPGK